jgi:hypothetical protein
MWVGYHYMDDEFSKEYDPAERCSTLLRLEVLKISVRASAGTTRPILISVLRIRDANPRSKFFTSRSPDPGSKRFSVPGPDPHQIIYVYLTQKLFISSRKYAPGCSSRIQILIFYPFRIPDPGVKKAPDSQLCR